MPRYFQIANWSEFQQYKDRRPTWIKLHVELLDHYEFRQLSDAAKGHLLLIWALAARLAKKASDESPRIPYDPAYVAQQIGASEEVDLERLAEAGFLQVTENAECTDAYGSVQNRSSETETETETEAEAESALSRERAREADPGDEDTWAQRQEEEFERFWNAYPVKDGRVSAERAWAETVDDRPPLPELIDHVARMTQTDRWREGYAPNPATYLRDHGWESVPETLNRPQGNDGIGPSFRNPTVPAPTSSPESHVEKCRQETKDLILGLELTDGSKAKYLGYLKGCSTVDDVRALQDQVQAEASAPEARVS